MRVEREGIIAMLCKAYWMEIAMVMRYRANSWADPAGAEQAGARGALARELARSSSEAIDEELRHATHVANRIRELYGVAPGSMSFQAEQSSLQPTRRQSAIVHAINDVIAAETDAIERYNTIIAATEDSDPLTNDVVSTILIDEEDHRRMFEGFLREHQQALR